LGYREPHTGRLCTTAASQAGRGGGGVPLDLLLCTELCTKGFPCKESMPL